MSTYLVAPPQITFSHGGAGEPPSYPAILGDGVGVGNPIEVWRAIAGGLNWPTFLLMATGTLSVDVQGNIGPMRGDGTLDSTMWFTFDSFNMSTGTANTIACPAAFGWVRSKITAWTSGLLISGVGAIQIGPGKVVKAQYPTKTTGGTG